MNNELKFREDQIVVGLKARFTNEYLTKHLETRANKNTIVTIIAITEGSTKIVWVDPNGKNDYGGLGYPLKALKPLREVMTTDQKATLTDMLNNLNHII
jgi:hypothetical protein